MYETIQLINFETYQHPPFQKPEIVFKSSEATLHLVSPVVLESGGRKTVAAVAGVRLDPSHLHEMLKKASRSQSGRSGGVPIFNQRIVQKMSCFQKYVSCAATRSSTAATPNACSATSSTIRPT